MHRTKGNIVFCERHHSHDLGRCEGGGQRKLPAVIGQRARKLIGRLGRVSSAAPGRVAIATGVALALAAVNAGAAAAAPRTPVVFFPGYGTTILQVTVHDQTTVKGCPASGAYQDGIPANVGTTFSQVCRDELITPRWSRNATLPWSERFSLPPGVKITIPNYSQTSSAPVYNPLFTALENAGYTADRNLVVAGYNFLLTPDLGGFLLRTKRLIERTWRRNGRTPVRLVGHSNGPLYAQYLLTHVSAAWKQKYIQGFTDIDGNLPGSGLLWGWVFTGAEVPSVFSYPTTVATARSSARLWARSPATWMSASDPAVFKNREVVIADQATGRSYTPANTVALLHAAGLDSIKGMVQHYLGFVPFMKPEDFPDVDVTVEAGSGIPTETGIALPNLTRGQVVDQSTAQYFTLPGDDNQEYITNNAVRVWRKMRCYRFRFNNNPGVGHLQLTSDPAVITRLLADLKQPRNRCPAGS
jgi:lecithin-cholesterol acyltransferase